MYVDMDISTTPCMNISTTTCEKLMKNNTEIK